MEVMRIASFPSVGVALLKGVHIEPKDAVSVKRSHENNVLCILLLTFSPFYYYKFVEKKEKLWFSSMTNFLICSLCRCIFAALLVGL